MNADLTFTAPSETWGVGSGYLTTDEALTFTAVGIAFGVGVFTIGVAASFDGGFELIGTSSQRHELVGTG
jgi:hypothetical protein